MGDECAMSEVVKGGGESELSLELSIGGGKYGKSENPGEDSADPIDNHSNYSFGSDSSADLLLQREREIQNLKRSREFENDNLLRRTKDRRVGEPGDNEVDDDELSLSLFTENRNVISGDCFLYQPLSCADGDGWSSGGVSVYHQVTSNKGGGSSNSEMGGFDEPYCSITKAEDDPENKAGSSSCPTQTRLEPSCNDTVTAAPLPGVGRMPRVSTTGNGPNGRTVTGFLYKYTTNEVSIVCACHGTSFSPAQFVDHAGGVSVSHPLRHITVRPHFEL